MEKAMQLLLHQPTQLTFAGRTDAGVHAREMYAHFDTGEEVIMDAVGSLTQLAYRLNGLLPESISIAQIQPVLADAHARFSATARTYQYCTTDHKDPFNTQLRTRVPANLDFESMNQAAQHLIGEKDFASFCRTHTDVKTTICTVTEAYWKDGIFTITANRFLRNMVRAIVGTLMDVGLHKLSIDDFAAIINQRNRCSAGQSAEAKGLYLTHIEYPNTIFTPISPNIAQKSE